MFIVNIHLPQVPPQSLLLDSKVNYDVRIGGWDQISWHLPCGRGNPVKLHLGDFLKAGWPILLTVEFPFSQIRSVGSQGEGKKERERITQLIWKYVYEDITHYPAFLELFLKMETILLSLFYKMCNYMRRCPL